MAGVAWAGASVRLSSSHVIEPAKFAFSATVESSSPWAFLTWASSVSGHSISAMSCSALSVAGRPCTKSITLGEGSSLSCFVTSTCATRQIPPQARVQGQIDHRLNQERMVMAAKWFNRLELT